jgi:hypothetical protein
VLAMANIRESDWKLFTKIKDEAIDQFCTKAFFEFKKILEDESKPIHDRYIEHFKAVRNMDKHMSQLFDGHSRSKAWLQMLYIRREGIANENLLSQLSDEFIEHTDSKRI